MLANPILMLKRIPASRTYDWIISLIDRDVFPDSLLATHLNHNIFYFDLYSCRVIIASKSVSDVVLVYREKRFWHEIRKTENYKDIKLCAENISVSLYLTKCF